MGRRTPFIDKKASRTIYLGQYELPGHSDATEGDVTAIERKEMPSVSLPVNQEACMDDEGLDEFDEGPPYANHSDWDDNGYALTLEQRREIMAMGFPDDGYDYLRHLRALGPASASKTAAAQLPAASSLTPQSASQHTTTGGSIGSNGAHNTVDDDPATSTSAGGSAASNSVTFTTMSIAHPPQLSPAVVPLASARPSGSAADVLPESTPAAGTAATAAVTVGAAPAGGQSVFIPAAVVLPAAPDLRLVDARHLARVAPANDDADAEARSADVSAFARPARPPKRGRLLQDLEELEKSMAAVEWEDGQEDLEENLGDWLDEFVVGASKVEEGGAAAMHHAAGRKMAGLAADDGNESAEDSEAYSLEDEEDVSDEGRDPKQAAGSLAAGTRSGRGGRAMSIASSYWRPERADRKEALQLLDSKFEVVAAEYDDDELGELDDDPTATGQVGASDVTAFEDVLDEFLLEARAGSQAAPAAATAAGGIATSTASERSGNKPLGSTAGHPVGSMLGSILGGARSRAARSQRHGAPSEAGTYGWGPGEQDGDEDYDGYEGGGGGGAAAAYGVRGQRRRVHKLSSAHKVVSLDEMDPEVISATRLRLQQLEAADERAAAAAEAGGPSVRQPWEDMPEPRPAERWDVESVLSLRSNVEHHPARIIEPHRKPRANAAAGLIKLSSKSGLPITVPSNSHAASSAPASAQSQPSQHTSSSAQRASNLPPVEEDEESAEPCSNTDSHSNNGGSTALAFGLQPLSLATPSGIAATAGPQIGRPSTVAAAAAATAPAAADRQHQQQPAAAECSDDGDVDSGVDGHAVVHAHADAESDEEGLLLLLTRPKDETKEEKKLRKAAVKASQRICRAAKKESKLIFKGEAMKQQKQHAGSGTAMTTYVIQ